MKRKRAGESKPCKSPQPPENINMYYPHGDTNIVFSESLDPAYISSSLPLSSCKTPSFMQLLLCGEDDIIDLSSSEEDVPSPCHGGSLMISGENEPSSSSSHPQPIHLPALIDKEAIGEHLLSQSLLDSVLRCLPSDLLVSSNNIVTSQHSRPQAGGDKEEAYFRSTPHVESMVGSSKCGPKYPVGPMNATNNVRRIEVTEGESQVQFSSSRAQPSHVQAGTTDKHADERLIKEKARSENRYLEVLNCKIPIAVKESGHPVRSEATNGWQDVQSLKKAAGKAPSWEKPFLETRTTKDGRPVIEAKHLKEITKQQKASEGCGIDIDVFTQVMEQDTHRYLSTHGRGQCPCDSSGPSVPKLKP